MTKAQFIELIKGKLTSADANPDLQDKYHEARVELFISMAFNDIIYQVFYKKLDEMDLYVRSYTVDISFDENYNQYYIDLPAKVLQLPYNCGIYKISPIKETWSFVPINQLSEDVFSELEVNTVCKEPSYYFDMTKAFFQNYDWKNKHLKQVRVDLIIPFEEYADDDQIVIPAGKESTIVELVFKMMGEQLAADNSTDLNDQQI